MKIRLLWDHGLIFLMGMMENRVVVKMIFFKMGTWIIFNQYVQGNVKYLLYKLTHLPLVPHICVRWNGPAFVQIMACRLDSAKPLSEPMPTYCQLEPKEHISIKFYLKFKYFHSRKCIWTFHLRNGSHFSRGRWVNNTVRFLPNTHNGHPHNYPTKAWPSLNRGRK